MSCCFNPKCPKPEVACDWQTCPSCGAQALLQERYRGLRFLGQGGFGRTILAVDESQALKSRCVIKQLFPQQPLENERALRLFRQEAERLKGLEHHPQVPDLLDYFEVEGQPYLVQEFVSGKNLAEDLLAGDRWHEAEVVALLKMLLPVVQFMHEHHVIHRDIKPANIIRRDRDQLLFLVDLGAAKVATGTALAMTGTVIGSAEYTAPEQTRGKATFASDVYSLGMTCLHLLTGISPFNLYDVEQGRLAWRDYLPEPISDRLARILERMTKEGMGQRYHSAQEVLRDLAVLEQQASKPPQIAQQVSWEDTLAQSNFLVEKAATRHLEQETEKVTRRHTELQEELEAQYVLAKTVKLWADDTPGKSSLASGLRHPFKESSVQRPVWWVDLAQTMVVGVGLLLGILLAGVLIGEVFDLKEDTTHDRKSSDTLIERIGDGFGK